MIQFDPYSPVILSGYSGTYSYSTKNFLTYDIDSSAFWYTQRYLQNPGYMTAWTTAKSEKNYKALANCAATKTYVAVGYGTKRFDASWSIVMRQREKSDKSDLEMCHKGLPNLTPGRNNAGITSVGYKLVVCGGYETLAVEVLNTCMYLDTKKASPKWHSMESMLNKRRRFSLVSYGDVVMAIGGIEGTTELDKVERWSEGKGWEECSALPKGLKKTCAVADEGSGNIYVAGGHDGISFQTKVYVYHVYTDQWSLHSTMKYPQTSICGITITTRQGDGHRQLMVSLGRYASNYYDLTAESSTWSTAMTTTSTDVGNLVALSPSESVKVS